MLITFLIKENAEKNLVNKKVILRVATGNVA